MDTQRVQFKKMKKKLAEQGISYEGPSQAEDQEPMNVAAKPVVGRLTDDRIGRLESIGFCVSSMPSKLANIGLFGYCSFAWTHPVNIFSICSGVCVMTGRSITMN